MVPPPLPVPQSGPPPLPKKKTPIWPYILAGIAVVFLILLVVAGTLFFQHAKKRNQANQAALKEITKAAADERATMVEAMQKGESERQLESVERFKQQMEKSAANASPNEAAVARAMSAYLSRVQDDARALDRASAPMVEVQIFAFKIPDRATLAKHRQIFTEFDAVNARFIENTRRTEDIIRSELAAANVPERMVESTMVGIRKTKPANQLKIRIREYDQHMTKAGAAILDLLEKNWGQWSYDQTAGRLIFQNDATLAAYNELIQKVHAAVAAQEKVQQEFVAAIQATGNP